MQISTQSIIIQSIDFAATFKNFRVAPYFQYHVYCLEELNAFVEMQICNGNVHTSEHSISAMNIYSLIEVFHETIQL